MILILDNLSSPNKHRSYFNHVCSYLFSERWQPPGSVLDLECLEPRDPAFIVQEGQKRVANEPLNNKVDR